MILGADITDYFNYGFTEETWAQYSERQRRLRAENNLARLNINHVKNFFQIFNYILYSNCWFFLDATNATNDFRSSSNGSSNESSSNDDD